MVGLGCVTFTFVLKINSREFYFFSLSCEQEMASAIWNEAVPIYSMPTKSVIKSMISVTMLTNGRKTECWTPRDRVTKFIAAYEWGRTQQNEYLVWLAQPLPSTSMSQYPRIDGRQVVKNNKERSDPRSSKAIAASGPWTWIQRMHGIACCSSLLAILH
jgi:hypothetical protein